MEQANSEEVDVGAVYQEHRRFLVGTVIARYGIGETEAETLVHDVFLAYILKADEVRDTRSWLIGAICNASKHYLRLHTRAKLTSRFLDEPDPASMELPERLPAQLAARECFACLTARCQLALRLRYFEGYSIPEIATELNTSERYAQKLVGRCLRMAYDRYEARGVDR